MLSLELFVNDKYKLLKFLYDNQIQVKENYYVTLSKQLVQLKKLFSEQFSEQS